MNDDDATMKEGEQLQDFMDDWVCPKCNTADPNVEYATVNRMVEGREVQEGERLAFECSTCGYKWITKTADARLPR